MRPAELTVLLDKVEKSLVITAGLRNIPVELRSDVLRGRRSFDNVLLLIYLLISFVRTGVALDTSGLLAFNGPI